MADPRQRVEDELQLRLDALSELARSGGDPAIVRAKQLSLLLEADTLARAVAETGVR